MPRFVRIAIYIVGAVLLVTWAKRQLDDAARVDSERQARAVAARNLNLCSSRVTKESLAANASRNADDILPIVLAECKSEYLAYETPVLNEPARAMQLRKRIEKEVKAQQAKKENDRKVALIEAAIEELGNQGVTQDDIKEYLEEDCSCKDNNE